MLRKYTCKVVFDSYSVDLVKHTQTKAVVLITQLSLPADVCQGVSTVQAFCVAGRHCVLVLNV